MKSTTTTTAVSRWVSFPTPNPGASLRLFCLPYAGGGAAIFRAWGRHLPPGVELCSVQLPGQGVRLLEPPFRRLTAMVEALAPPLLPYMDRPFAFFGHSMGAMISFELARWLRRAGRALPVELFVSGRRAPQLPTDPPSYDWAEADFIAELRRLNGTPQEVLEHRDLMQLILPQLRADFEVVQTYQYTPEPPLDCPVSVFGGLEDCGANRELLAPWRAQTTGPFSLQMFPGDHFFLHTEEPLFLRTLAKKLHRAAESGAGGAWPRATATGCGGAPQTGLMPAVNILED
jgi:medium-chain acyl-[acyl-carrier-protein] hydrolase